MARASPAASPSTGELRQVVVLFADLEDYTGLSLRLDPEDVHRILGRFFHVVDGTVAEFGGTIDKHIGDNVMALFGAPVAHGNDAERAVRAALAMHERVAALCEELSAPLRVHIGIAAGQVMASSLGSSHHSEYTVIGSSVNLAARLQGSAAGGETVVDESVYRAVAPLVEAESIEELELKGIGRAMRAWRVNAMRRGVHGPNVPLVGRVNELRLIAGALERCRERGRGEVLLIRGGARRGQSPGCAVRFRRAWWRAARAAACADGPRLVRAPSQR